MILGALNKAPTEFRIPRESGDDPEPPTARKADM